MPPPLSRVENVRKHPLDGSPRNNSWSQKVAQNASFVNAETGKNDHYDIVQTTFFWKNMKKMQEIGQDKPHSKVITTLVVIILFLLIGIIVLLSLLFWNDVTDFADQIPEDEISTEMTDDSQDEDVLDIEENDESSEISALPYLENTSRNIDFSFESTYLNQIRNTNTYPYCQKIAGHDGVPVSELNEEIISQMLPELDPTNLTAVTHQIFTILDANNLNIHQKCQGTGWQILTAGNINTGQLMLMQINSDALTPGQFQLNQFETVSNVIDMTYDIIDFGDFVGLWHGYGDAGIVSWEVRRIDFESMTLDLYESCQAEAFMDPGQLTCEREYISG